MNLAIVTETFPPEINGVAMTFGTIATELGRQGHRVTVYRPARPDLPAGTERDGFREVSLPGMPIPGYPLLRIGWPAGRRLRRQWSRERPDLVHVVTEGPLGVSAVTAARRMRLPVTSSFHTNFHRYARHYGVAFWQRWVVAWLRRVHNRTERTFAPTAESQAELAALGIRGLGILSRGVDTRRFAPDRRSRALREAWGVKPDQPVLLHVGRLAAEKNYPLLFRCYETMLAVNPTLRLVLVGDGPLGPRLRREHPDCHFAGFVDRDALASHYASADVYVHPSLTETFGNVLPEALASGLAVAGFDYAAAAQFIRDGENGLIAARDQPSALVAAGVRLATEIGLRARLRRNAPASVAGHSWESIVERFAQDLAGVARSFGS